MRRHTQVLLTIYFWAIHYYYLPTLRTKEEAKDVRANFITLLCVILHTSAKYLIVGV